MSAGAALSPSDRAPGLVLGPGVEIPDDATIGANVVVHAGVEVGPGCVLQDGVLLGKRPQLDARAAAAGDIPARLVLGPGAAVCAHAIVFAGSELGAGVIVGDQAYVRERVSIGAGTVIGRGTAVDNDVEIGARVRIQTDVYGTARPAIQDEVFV